MMITIQRDQQKWLYIAAGALFVLAYAVALWRNNALYYSAGVVGAAALLAPLWWSRPRIALMGFVIYFALQDGLLSYFAHGVTPARIVPDVLLGIAFLWRVWLAYSQKEPLFSKGGFFRRGIEAPMLFLLAVSVISLLVNHVPLHQAIQGPYVMFRYILVFYLAAASDYSVREAWFFVRALAWSLIVQFVVSFVQFVQLHLNFSSGIFNARLVQGTQLHFNILGVYLALTTIIAIAAFRPEVSQRLRLELSVIVGLAAFTIMLATSRQSIAALLLGAATLFMVNRQALTKATWKQWSVIAAVFVMSIGIGYVAIAKTPFINIGHASQPGGVSTPLQTVTGGKVPGGAGGSGFTLDPAFTKNARLYAIENGGKALLTQSPLFGKGPGTYGAQATYHDQKFYDNLNVGLLLSDPQENFVSDVEWLNVLGQIGLLGVAGVLWLFFAFGRIGYRVWRVGQDDLTRRLGIVCIAFIPAFLLLDFFGPNLEIRQISILLWFIPGLVLSLLANERKPANRVTLADTAFSQGWKETQKRSIAPKTHA